MDTSNPLVSIIVITYNSSKYIIETLESAKNQTYTNIELIISDDNSQDDTILLCQNWKQENSAKFSEVKIIKTSTNTGIPGNCNRGVQAAKGDWIKLIAGDDVLTAGCITDNINFANKNTEVQFIISNMISFDDELSNEKSHKIMKPRQQFVNLKLPQEQYDALLIKHIGNTPSYFVSKTVYDLVLFDERFPFIEDYPFVLNVSKHKILLHFLDKETVYYRIHYNSAFRNKKDVLFSNFYIKKQAFNKVYRYPFLLKRQLYKELFDYYTYLVFDSIGLNRKNKFNRFLFKSINRMNPFLYFK